MAQDKSVTFRVRQIPAGITKFELSNYVQTYFNEDVDAPIHVVVRSLAPSPDDWEAQAKQTGTIEFSKLPARFAQGKQTQWRIASRTSEDVLLFDKHFLGFTPMNKVEEDQHSYDCIAISGLASHAFGSWRWCDEDGSQFMWLRDQLPVDFPGLRIMTYGYDTDLLDSDSVQSIDDLARTFILQLKTIGRAQPMAKPMILLVHSLGGILVKRALLYLANGGDIEDLLLSKCSLVIAFGVPNSGMHIKHLRAIVKDQPNESLLHTLGPYSPYLDTIDESFYGIVQKRTLRIVSVFETKRSPTAMLNSSGKWERTGPSELLVSRISAIQKASRDPEDVIPIHRDHSGIVKFMPGEASYNVIKGCVRETIFSDPTDVLQNLMGQRPSESADMETPIEDEHESAELALLKIKDKSSEAYIRLNKKQQARLKVFWNMLSSFRFPEQNRRLETIEEAQDATLEWVYEKQEIGFLDWISRGDGIFWIRGKPGCGKSTLMKYLHQHQRFQEPLSARSIEQNCKIIDLWFFFNARGGLQEITFDGLLRTILLQIVDSNKHLALLMLKEYESPQWLPFRQKANWRTKDLERLFDVILSQTTVDIELLLFLDALDEYEGFPQVIARWLIKLTYQSESCQRRTKVRICFASREWDAFIISFDHCKGFKLHDHTFDDIRKYTSARIAQMTFSRKARWQSKKALPDQLSQLIAQKAEGVFLWVRFALDDLEHNAHLLDGNAVEVYVDRLPDQLEVFYISSIDRIAQHNRYRAFILLEIVLRSPSPMTVPELYFAAESCQASTYVRCSELYQQGKLRSQNHLTNLSVELINQCSGLLECVKRSNDNVAKNSEANLKSKLDSSYVQFIHKTVKDFVGSPGLAARLLDSSHGMQRENGYSWLFKFRLVYGGCTYTELSFLAYQSERTLGRSAETFLESIPSDRFVHFMSLDHSLYLAEDKKLFASQLVFALISDLNLYLETALTKSHARQAMPLHAIAVWCVNNSRYYGKDALWSHKPNFAKIFTSLIMNKSVGDAKWRGRTPWDLLFVDWTIKGMSNDRLELAKAMMREGRQHPDASLFVEQVGSRTCGYRALHVAVPDGPMVALLLENGADPNMPDVMGRTPLDQWLQCASILAWSAETVQAVLTSASLLLSHGGRIANSNRKRWTPLYDSLISLADQHNITVPANMSAYRRLPPNESTSRTTR